jgi:hypothetical protein
MVPVAAEAMPVEAVPPAQPETMQTRKKQKDRTDLIATSEVLSAGFCMRADGVAR